MDHSHFINEYQIYLRQYANPTRAIKEKAYLYSEFKHYGLSTAQRNQFFKLHKKELKALSKPNALLLIKALWAKPSHEEKNFSLDILKLHQDSLTIKDMLLIELFMRESKEWALLDNLIIPIMPGILERYPKAYRYLHAWIKDPGFWVRRSALLAQLLFFRKGSGGDKQLFFDLAASQLNESWIDLHYPDPLQNKRAKFFIRKAIGWTLREMSAKDPDSVITFVNQYKEKLSGLSYREATRKLLPESKKFLR